MYINLQDISMYLDSCKIVLSFFFSLLLLYSYDFVLKFIAVYSVNSREASWKISLYFA